jgi:hypothetical protein
MMPRPPTPSDPRQRLVLQYLEPGPLVESADPGLIRDHLAFAVERLRPTDLALGWRLDPDLVAVLRPSIPADVSVWRWTPMLTGLADPPTTGGLRQVGPSLLEPVPFRGMDDFRFSCPSHDSVIEASIERAVRLAREIDADGVLLDRIRWHSPSRSPFAELTCFCGRCCSLASGDGISMDDVERTLASAACSVEGRRGIVRALLGDGVEGVVAEFVTWRRDRITAAVSRMVEGLRRRGLRTSLDVFSPALARSVGQDLATLSVLGEWSKSMTYFDALGPATMPYELLGYAGWLAQAGETDAPGFLAELLGFDPPGVRGSGARLEALGIESSRLVDAVGQDRAIVGLDAVEIPGVCEVDDDVLAARLATVRSAGLGLAPSWELLAIGRDRIERTAAVVRA